MWSQVTGIYLFSKTFMSGGKYGLAEIRKPYIREKEIYRGLSYNFSLSLSNIFGLVESSIRPCKPMLSQIEGQLASS